MTRYAVQLSAYLWAENDDGAREIAHEYAQYLDAMPQHEDNKCTADLLVEMPFGHIGSGRKVTIY